jgi:hypothetical protein
VGDFDIDRRPAAALDRPEPVGLVVEVEVLVGGDAWGIVSPRRPLRPIFRRLRLTPLSSSRRGFDHSPKTNTTWPSLR